VPFEGRLLGLLRTRAATDGMRLLFLENHLPGRGDYGTSPLESRWVYLRHTESARIRAFSVLRVLRARRMSGGEIGVLK
jgi:hypothetical protein